MGAFPSIVPDGAGAIATGATRRQERAAAGFMGLAHPSPVPACLPLGGALEGIRSSALYSAARAGNPGQVGGKSAEGYTLAKIDVQGCTDARGVGKIAVGRELTISLVVLNSPLRRPSEISSSGGFRFSATNRINTTLTELELIPDGPDRENATGKGLDEEMPQPGRPEASRGAGSNALLLLVLDEQVPRRSAGVGLVLAVLIGPISTVQEPTGKVVKAGPLGVLKVLEKPVLGSLQAVCGVHRLTPFNAWESSPDRFLRRSARSSRPGKASSRAWERICALGVPVMVEMWSSSNATEGETSTERRSRGGEAGGVKGCPDIPVITNGAP